MAEDKTSTNKTATNPTRANETGTDNQGNATDKKDTGIQSDNTGATGRKAELEKQGVPSNDVAVPPQVVSRDELAKPEYNYDGQRLEIDRGHPNYIFDNQRNQQAQENTVEVAAGIRNNDGTMKPNHPLADVANPKVVSDDGTGETDEEKKNREELSK